MLHQFTSIYVLLLVVTLFAFSQSFVQIRSCTSILLKRYRNTNNLALSSQELDPNFEEHLPMLLKRGRDDNRSAPDLANDLRKRYATISDTKRKAAKTIGTSNTELAAELSEMADELAETTEKFVALAQTWDAWNRPDPNLASNLRQSKQKEDPNFQANLPQMLLVGKDENRPSSELPSELRLLRYKNMASVKRIAANHLNKQGGNEELARELEEMADEIEESHQRFVDMAKSFTARKEQDDKSVSTR